MRWADKIGVKPMGWARGEEARTMDPNATLAAWIDAAGSRSPERITLAREYNAWRDRGGFPAEAKAWSDRVLGVPVLVTVNRLGREKADVTFSYNGAEWSGKIYAGRFLGA